MATTPATPEKMTLDRSDGSATIDLYRAVLGPVHAEYYLKTFTRFDAAGSSGASWNWAAALLSLNWMLFRKLWTIALAYVGALTAAILLLFGIGRLVFQMAPDTQWLLALAGVLITIAIPGAYGNAWLYAHCNRKMERALAESVTLEDACALLMREAVGTRRMLSLAGLNVSLGSIVAAIALSWPQPGDLPLQTGPVAQAHVEGLVQSAPKRPEVSAPVTTPNLAASAPQEPASVASAAAATTASVEAPKPEPEKEAAPPKPEKAAKLNKAERRAKAKADLAAQKAKAETKAAEISLGGPRTETPRTETGSASETGKFLINVGLFADENNARNALVKLQDAGLPALSQEIKSSKGKRTRVRVGPFESQPEADRAAERIRALQLDAVVFKQ